MFPGTRRATHCIISANPRLSVILNIILLIDVFVDPNYFENDSLLLFVNYYVSLIGVVFATGTHHILHHPCKYSVTILLLVWSSSYTYKTTHINFTQSIIGGLQVQAATDQTLDGILTHPSERAQAHPDRYETYSTLSHVLRAGTSCKGLSGVGTPPRWRFEWRKTPNIMWCGTVATARELKMLHISLSPPSTTSCIISQRETLGPKYTH